jgi:hypothetical protein
MGSGKGFVNHRIDIKYVVLIIVVGFLGMMLLIANPGYFSHDEWQKYDHYAINGFYDYVKSYVQFRTGNTFGYPVRPVAFFVQGLHSLFFENYPVLVHLFNVVSTLIAAVIIYCFCRWFALSRSVSSLVAILFELSPLTVLATGWPAALMDQMYLIFGLLTTYVFISYVGKKENSVFLLLWIPVFCLLTIFSKETGIVFPAVIVMLLFFHYEWWTDRKKQLLMATLVWIFPIVVYLICRKVAIVNSLNMTPGDAYGASLGHVAKNALIYWVYPFLPLVSEAGTTLFQPTWRVVVAGLLHIILLALVIREYGWKYGFLYLASYFVFLIPVLLIPFAASHYMFASAIPMSVVLALFLFKKNYYFKFFAFILSSVLLWHSFAFQDNLYRVGVCQNKISTTLSSSFESFGRPKNIYFTVQPDSPAHILYRFIFGRNQIGKESGINFHVNPKEGEVKNSDLLLTFNRDCNLVYSPYGALIKEYGPRRAELGKILGLWIEFNQSVNASKVKIYFNGVELKDITVDENLVKASVNAENVFKSGNYLVEVQISDSPEKQVVGSVYLD